jgi:hypothetical protein
MLLFDPLALATNCVASLEPSGDIPAFAVNWREAEGPFVFWSQEELEKLFAWSTKLIRAGSPYGKYVFPKSMRGEFAGTMRPARLNAVPPWPPVATIPAGRDPCVKETLKICADKSFFAAFFVSVCLGDVESFIKSSSTAQKVN